MQNFLIDLNPVERKYYPFTISLSKCNGNCNTLNYISDKMCPEQNKGYKFKCDNKNK